MDALSSATVVSAGGATRPALRGGVDVLRYSRAVAGVHRVETGSPDVYPSMLQSAHPSAEPKVKLNRARARTTENAPPIAKLPLGRPAVLEEATPMTDPILQPPEVAPSSPVLDPAAGSEGSSENNRIDVWAHEGFPRPRS